MAAIQVAALDHPDQAMRRSCLFLLDHYASDASWHVFRRALGDPVSSVREAALHGFSCERCRNEALCVTDVVSDLVDMLASDPSAEVRHKTLAILASFANRDARTAAAIARAAQDDADAAIRHAAKSIVDTGRPHVRRRRATIRDARRAAAIGS